MGSKVFQAVGRVHLNRCLSGLVQRVVEPVIGEVLDLGDKPFPGGYSRHAQSCRRFVAYCAIAKCLGLPSINQLDGTNIAIVRSLVHGTFQHDWEAELRHIKASSP